MSSYPHWETIPLRWKDNDVYGHVNNVVHYSLMDTVINTWLIERGGLDVSSGAVIGLCVESQCSYHTSVSFPGSLRVGLRVARLLAPDFEWPGDFADHLPAVLTNLMNEIGIPNGIGAVGYTESDVDSLVEGTLQQQRLLATAPREASAEDLAGVLRESVSLW